MLLLFYPTFCRRGFYKPLSSPYATKSLADFHAIRVNLDLEGLSAVFFLFFLHCTGEGCCFFVSAVLPVRPHDQARQYALVVLVFPPGSKKRRFMSAKMRHPSICLSEIC